MEAGYRPLAIHKIRRTQGTLRKTSFDVRPWADHAGGVTIILIADSRSRACKKR